jgi:pimeloyl-ACP methyl ester carboxylesterase
MVTPARPRGASSRPYDELAQAVLDHYGVPTASRTLDVRGLPVHVLEHGRGVPALLLHGGDGEAWNFAGLMAELGDDLHMYAADRPNFGRSGSVDYRRVCSFREHATDFVMSLLDELGLESAVVIAASFGGLFGLAAALARPDRVRALLLPAYPAGLVRQSAPPAGVTSPVPAGPPAADGRTADGQREMYERMWGVRPGQLPEVFFEARAAGARLPGAEATWQLLRRRTVGRHDVWSDAYFGDDLHRITPPALLVLGGSDGQNAERGRAAARRMPDCRCVVMPDAGHFPFLQAPAETATVIKEFLRDRHVRS